MNEKAIYFVLFQYLIPGMKDALETFVKKPYITVKDQFWKCKW